jgi:hypothetical protein
LASMLWKNWGPLTTRNSYCFPVGIQARPRAFRRETGL